ncbi:oxygen-dependent coproporphyrinogen oxidase [Candidatus Bandiella euplotis]|uniref:coproporphyrinogen oxidase n=1 Tax=Candidatus Bandiella euplotis TaxID=1664265 RepID=A0ABZ0UKE6_9RICK|nr:oxygen-dependent coproporphyrinogen oxidase [Candidatus Bandiella woodruffii]WPX96417.1 Coproporphyrinogen-III oxidase, aerobic [Candidatus Bandiella woodruffii]
METLENQKQLAIAWFANLRNSIRQEFEKIEELYGTSSKFKQIDWKKEDGGGGGEMSIMHGEVFEKVGVNISTVYGEFSENFAKEIPGCENGDRQFWASGISLVAHMRSPHVPAAHFNTRMIVTTKQWFGGGGDLTPVFPDDEDTRIFHSRFKAACDKFDPDYYPKFKKNCDEYFYLPHRNEPRGVGGIFYDYLNTNDWQKDFEFTMQVGVEFKNGFLEIIKRNVMKKWNEEERVKQLQKRGRYVEFNLLYDRGTKFGLMTNGNTEAILMSMPPHAAW